jgi:hypothetical protein
MSHLSDLKMTYWEHLFGALHYAFLAFSAGYIFIFHGLFPDYCVYTGSILINNLNTKLKEKKLLIE